MARFETQEGGEQRGELNSRRTKREKNVRAATTCSQVDEGDVKTEGEQRVCSGGEFTEKNETEGDNSRENRKNRGETEED